jgi:hypothetical protein
MVGKRHTAFAVVLADESAPLPEAEFREAGVAQNDSLQAQQLFAVERLASGLANRAAPALDAIRRRALALDSVARPRVFEQKKCRRTGEQVARKGGDDVLRAWAG